MSSKQMHGLWLVAVLVVAAPLAAQLPSRSMATPTIGTRVGLPLTGYQGGGRDPFASLVDTSPTKAKQEPERRAPGLAGMAAADVVLRGIIAGAAAKIALLEGTGGQTYLAREGDRLHDATVLTIEADGLVLRVAATGTSVVRDVRKSLRPSGGTDPGRTES
jgi:hypothetical protein